MKEIESAVNLHLCALLAWVCASDWLKFAVTASPMPPSVMTESGKLFAINVYRPKHSGSNLSLRYGCDKQHITLSSKEYLDLNI